MIPERGQRSRKKGYKMVHPNGLENHYVGRRKDGSFGNPFKLENGMVYVDTKYRRQVCDQYVFLCDGNDQLVQDLYRAVVLDDFSKLSNVVSDICYRSNDVKSWVIHFKKVDFSILKGKNLYCFCPLFYEDNKRFPCHADVLLEIVNKEL